MRMRGLSSSLLALLISISAAAAAQEEPTPAEVEARALFSAGEAAYSAGRFEDALGHFQRAYDLSQRHQLLYNIGLAAANLGRPRDALQAFERYLSEVPDADNRAVVEGRITALRRQVGEEDARQRQLEEEARARQAAEEESRRRAAESGSGPRTTGWILTIAGGAVAIAGGVFFVLGLGAVSTVEDAPDDTPWLDVKSDYDNAPLFTGIGAAGIAIGVATAAIGCVLIASGGSDGSESAPPASAARLTLGVGGLRLEGTF